MQIAAKTQTIFVFASVILAAQTIAPTGAFAEKAERLKGSALEKAVAGKVIHMKTEGVTLPISYKRNKTMTGKLRAVASMLAGKKTPTSDQGKWWIDKDRLCQRWNRWLDGKSFCYTLKREGQTVHWVRNDGRKGTARLVK